MDRLDVELEDAELLGEVELTAALIVAANQADGHLSPAEVDAILGLAETSPAADADAPEADPARAPQPASEAAADSAPERPQP